MEMADKALKADARVMERKLDALALEPGNTKGSHLRAAINVGWRDNLLVCLRRRDIVSAMRFQHDPANSVSERALRPSVICRKVTNCFRSAWAPTSTPTSNPLSQPAATLAGTRLPAAARRLLTAKWPSVG